MYPMEVVVPMEESIQALLEYFLEPFLSNQHPKTKTAVPSISNHQFIAKQVHAVVLLYNYYLRKSHQSLEYLNLESFCKLVVVMKPNLMLYMKLMRQAKYSEVLDLENHLSETEKSIVDACNISLALDATKQLPNCQSWPISKVAILLTDASKDKCLLHLGIVTSGAWSLIEKSVDVINMDCIDKIGGNRVYRRMRSTKNSTINDQSAHEAKLQKVAFAAIEEAAEINQTDLLVLERHDVYSLSKEKTVTRFYIVQCAQSSREDFQISIREVVDSLQGSLVKKKSNGWVMSSAVEYFHILPYAGIMRDWLSRKGLEDLKGGSGIKHHNNSPVALISHKTEFSDRKSVSSKAFNSNVAISKTSNQIEESFQKKDSNKCQVNCLSIKVDEPCGMEIDDLQVSYLQNKKIGQSSSSRAKFHDQPQNMIASDSHEHASHTVILTEPDKVNSKSMNPCLHDEIRDSQKQNSLGIPVHGDNNELLPVSLNPKYVEKLRDVASKESALSQTALKVLLKTREILSHQLHTIQDEIASCDREIQAMLQGAENRSGKDPQPQRPELWSIDSSSASNKYAES